LDLFNLNWAQKYALEVWKCIIECSNYMHVITVLSQWLKAYCIENKILAPLRTVKYRLGLPDYMSLSSVFIPISQRITNCCSVLNCIT